MQLRALDGLIHDGELLPQGQVLGSQVRFRHEPCSQEYESSVLKSHMTTIIPTVENFRCYPGLPRISNDASPVIEARIEFSVGTRLSFLTLRAQRAVTGIYGIGHLRCRCRNRYVPSP